jgi:hypothetical protein
MRGEEGAGRLDGVRERARQMEEFDAEIRGTDQTQGSLTPKKRAF